MGKQKKRSESCAAGPAEEPALHNALKTLAQSLCDYFGCPLSHRAVHRLYTEGVRKEEDFELFEDLLKEIPLPLMDFYKLRENAQTSSSDFNDPKKCAFEVEDCEDCATEVQNLCDALVPKLSIAGGDCTNLAMRGVLDVDDLKLMNRDDLIGIVSRVSVLKLEKSKLFTPQETSKSLSPPVAAAGEEKGAEGLHAQASAAPPAPSLATPLLVPPATITSYMDQKLAMLSYILRFCDALRQVICIAAQTTWPNDWKTKLLEVFQQEDKRIQEANEKTAPFGGDDVSRDWPEPRHCKIIYLAMTRGPNPPLSQLQLAVYCKTAALERLLVGDKSMCSLYNTIKHEREECASSVFTDNAKMITSAMSQWVESVCTSSTFQSLRGTDCVAKQVVDVLSRLNALKKDLEDDGKRHITSTFAMFEGIDPGDRSLLVVLGSPGDDASRAELGMLGAWPWRAVVCLEAGCYDKLSQIETFEGYFKVTNTCQEVRKDRLLVNLGCGWPPTKELWFARNFSQFLNRTLFPVDYNLIFLDLSNSTPPENLRMLLAGIRASISVNHARIISTVKAATSHISEVIRDCNATFPQCPITCTDATLSNVAWCINAHRVYHGLYLSGRAPWEVISKYKQLVGKLTVVPPSSSMRDTPPNLKEHLRTFVEGGVPSWELLHFGNQIPARDCEAVLLADLSRRLDNQDRQNIYWHRPPYLCGASTVIRKVLLQLLSSKEQGSRNARPCTAIIATAATEAYSSFVAACRDYLKELSESSGEVVPIIFVIEDSNTTLALDIRNSIRNLHNLRVTFISVMKTSDGVHDIPGTVSKIEIENICNYMAPLMDLEPNGRIRDDWLKSNSQVDRYLCWGVWLFLQHATPPNETAAAQYCTELNRRLTDLCQPPQEGTDERRAFDAVLCIAVASGFCDLSIPVAASSGPNATTLVFHVAERTWKNTPATILLFETKVAPKTVRFVNSHLAQRFVQLYCQSRSCLVDAVTTLVIETITFVSVYSPEDASCLLHLILSPEYRSKEVKSRREYQETVSRFIGLFRLLDSPDSVVKISKHLHETLQTLPSLRAYVKMLTTSAVRLWSDEQGALAAFKVACDALDDYQPTEDEHIDFLVLMGVYYKRKTDMLLKYRSYIDDDVIQSFQKAGQHFITAREHLQRNAPRANIVRVLYAEPQLYTLMLRALRTKQLILRVKLLDDDICGLRTPFLLFDTLTSSTDWTFAVNISTICQLLSRVGRGFVDRRSLSRQRCRESGAARQVLIPAAEAPIPQHLALNVQWSQIGPSPQNYQCGSSSPGAREILLLIGPWSPLTSESFCDDLGRLPPFFQSIPINVRECLGLCKSLAERFDSGCGSLAIYAEEEAEVLTEVLGAIQLKAIGGQEFQSKDINQRRAVVILAVRQFFIPAGYKWANLTLQEAFSLNATCIKELKNLAQNSDRNQSAIQEIEVWNALVTASIQPGAMSDHINQLRMWSQAHSALQDAPTQRKHATLITAWEFCRFYADWENTAPEERQRPATIQRFKSRWTNEVCSLSHTEQLRTIPSYIAFTHGEVLKPILRVSASKMKGTPKKVKCKLAHGSHSFQEYYVVHLLGLEFASFSISRAQFIYSQMRQHVDHEVEVHVLFGEGSGVLRAIFFGGKCTSCGEELPEFD